MSLIKCPECGHQVSDRARTCPSCGIDISGNIIICPHCGNIRFADEPQCPVCSSRSRKEDPVKSQEKTMEQPIGPDIHVSEKQRKSSSATIIGFIVAVVLVLLCIFGYYYVRNQNEQQAYDNAMSTQLPTMLKTYLNKYGSHAPEEHVTAVQDILRAHEEMTEAWQKTISHPTKSALDSFILNYPQSVYIPEAKIVVDSLDWSEATKLNTVEAYKQYLDNHATGLYIDEALVRYELLDSKTISKSDSLMVITVHNNYFQALASSDESLLKQCFTTRISSFLHKSGSTHADVIAYMKRLHAPKDIKSFVMQPLGDWVITKATIDGKRVFNLRFTVDHKIVRTNHTKQSFHTYNVQSKVTSSGKICELNMERIQH